MSKQYKMRWRDSDVQELERAINNFNQKLYRTKKKNPEAAAYLPDRAKKSDIIKSIGSRADFKKIITSLKSFSKRGAEKPVKIKGLKPITKWQKQEFNKLKRRDALAKKKELERLKDKEIKVGGTPTGYTRLQMGTIRENQLQPYNKKATELTKHEFDKAYNMLRKRFDASARAERIKTMKDNYIKGLRDSGILGRDPELETIINDIDDDEFLDTVINDETGSFEFYSSPEEVEVRTEYIHNTWTQASQNSKQRGK